MFPKGEVGVVQYEVSEAVARGHPDKVADQISDAILDACLQNDPFSRVAVEALVSHNLIAIGGEISSSQHVDIHDIVHGVLEAVGYTSSDFASFVSRLRIETSLEEQSSDISHSVGTKGAADLTAGDQGTMYGFACQETKTFMPRSYEIARGIVSTLQALRSMPHFAWLGPDGKTQVAFSRESKNQGSIVLSWQHAPHIDIHDVRALLSPVVEEVASQYGFTPHQVLINPSGRFVLGGPLADTGCTGRKQMVDSYGGAVLHGGGSYSGKDGTKVDRSGAYMARWVAKHIVATGLARICEVQLIYSIGKKTPLHIGIDCYGTETIPCARIVQAVHKTFDFSVSSIIRELRLTTPIFLQTSFGGHFGRKEFPWEELRACDELLTHV